jgi:glycosyltransferase involved in cell wall biosynthesis/peptidoglycan/xylan/chitin deacetylase (PgdA/CDA1 family)
MSNPEPAISVIIPCFNQGATLAEAVDSILNQTFTDLEIVIVNDGSTDPATNSLLETYHRPKTRVITTANRGLAEARNTAIRNSRGKYILPLDADDRFRPEYLALAVPILENNAEVLIVYCAAERFGEECGLVELPPFSRKTMLFRNAIFCSALFRRSDYDETRGYRSNVRAYEDWDLWLSLLEIRPAGSVVKIPEALFNYRIRTNCMIRSLTESEIRVSRRNLFLNHIALYEEYGIDPIALYSADQELEKECVQLENEYLEIRNSLEYRIGSFILKPFGTTAVARTMDRIHRLKQLSFSRNSPSIKAIPNPVRISMNTGVGETLISWWPGSADKVEIHVDSPDGPIFAEATTSGSAATGKWVRNGMTFYLQDVSDGLPLTSANTLATTQIVGVGGGVVARTASTLRRATKSLQAQVASSGLILMYHRITSSPRDPWQLNVTPEHFEGHLEVLQRYCRPWPLQRALRALQDGGLPPRTVVVTFDDGYRDNFINAKPLIEKYDVSATLFLANGYIDSKRGFWWDEMERLVSEDKASTPASFHSVYSSLQSMTDPERWAALEDLRAKAGMAGKPLVSHPILSFEEVAALDKSELVEIGSHTVTHSFLSGLPHHRQREEILRGKRELEQVLGHEVTSFAYPNGQYDAETVSLVEKAGFSCACSTNAGVLTRDADRFRLPRVQVSDCDAAQFERWISDWFERCQV